MKNRTDILNQIISHFGYQRYLEIGVLSGKNFAKIQCPHKEGVDPAVNCTHQTTSDRFFLETQDSWDLIFVDGDHEEDQTDRDVRNSLEHLRPNGTIALHDCNPPSAWHQRSKIVVQGREAWMGQVWKSLAKLRIGRPELAVCTVNLDQGIGIVRRGKQKCFQIPAGFALDYGHLALHREELLNLIPVSALEGWLNAN